LITAKQLVPPGRIFFGLALVAFGILQFVYGDFVPGRAPAWPSSIPGRLGWAYLSGAVLIAAGSAIIAGRKVREAGILAGTLILCWALLRQLPALAANPHGIILTNAGKATALAGGAFALAGFPVLGRVGLGGFMILGGIQHFNYIDFVARLVPAWIPGPVSWAYLAGVALIAGGVGMLVPRTAGRAAALSGLMIFLWVLILHLPRAVAAGAAQSRNEWTALFEALAFSGIALTLAGIARASGEKDSSLSS